VSLVDELMTDDGNGFELRVVNITSFGVVDAVLTASSGLR
jgi:hypothetical protein